MIRDFTRLSLERAGYQVTVAANGREALTAMAGRTFALILVDIDMPIMDGLTAAKKIRQLPDAGSNVPIVAFSGDRQYVFDPAFSDYLAKPFRKAELLSKVGYWLSRSAKTIAPLVSLRPNSDFDFKNLREADEMMGRNWTMRGLNRLREQIDETFRCAPTGDRCEVALASRAHQLVSTSALLGFTALSDLCSSLVAACRSGADIRKPFEQARVAGVRARKAAATLCK